MKLCLEYCEVFPFFVFYITGPTLKVKILNNNGRHNKRTQSQFPIRERRNGLLR